MKYFDFKTVVGYSGFVLFEECYEYNENACFIADDENLAKDFMNNCGLSPDEYRIDKVKFEDIMNDYGCSSGEYAMESKAFSIFKEIAERNNIKYEADEFDLDASLMVVQVSDVKL